jgi:hypothetical protein
VTVSTQLQRRTFLKGLGASMALPMLECMQPGLTLSTAAAAETATAAPVRMAFVFFPNGAIMPNWKPEGEGTDYTLSHTLEPLKDFRGDFNVISGLAQDNGRAKGDGPGDHARCASTYLTGAHPVKTSGANIKVGISVDQMAAAEIGKQTRLPSLELGVDRGRNAGNCDSGYSCAYSSNVSWKTATTPMAKEINPRLAFERLFGVNQKDEKKRLRRELYRKSILDLVRADAQQLKNRLGATDRQKIDEYFTSVREIEQRIARSAAKRHEVPEFDIPEGMPREQTEHIRLMYDLMVLAFQTDTTRVSTFMLANAGANRSYSMVGVKDGWHSLSHHRNDEKKMADITKIDRFLVEQFGYFLGKLKAIKEGEGTLLDNCMLMYGSGLSDANRHNHDDLPILLAGKGGGTIETGRHIKMESETPLNNLFLSMLDRAGAKVDSIGDSKGRLAALDG